MLVYMRKSIVFKTISKELGDEQAAKPKKLFIFLSSPNGLL